MPEEKRKAEARDAANEYAPQPEGSSITYGLIAVVLLALALWVVGRFYGLNFLLHPISVGAAVVIVFIGGIALRKTRKRRHNAAFRSEYERGRGHPPKETTPSREED